MWTVYITIAALAILDRFTTNYWPRQTFHIGKGSAGKDILGGLRPGPWSVQFYDALARVSGRFAIVAFNLLLVTRFRSLEYFFTTNRMVKTYIMDCSDIVNANNRLHQWNGIALCTLTLLHVWSILLPCLTHGYKATVVVGNFEWPLSERYPKGFKDVNNDTKTMALQVDDVFRLCEMTLLLGVLMPLCIHCLSKYWHIGIHLHRFIAIIYFVDIVRRHTHPHSWVLNTPVFVLWLLDQVWNKYWQRIRDANVQCTLLSHDYMVVFWNQPPQPPKNATKTTTVGPDYRLKLQNSSLWESPHIFTSFENRCRVGLPQLDDETGVARGNETSDDDDDDDDYTSSRATTAWTTAAVIRVFRHPRVLPVGKQDHCSHTQRMYDEAATGNNRLRVTLWGPRQGEMSEHVKNALLSSSPSGVVLVAAGSGINYILDALQWRAADEAFCSSSSRITLLYSTRDAALFDWIWHVVLPLLIKSQGPIPKVVLAYTGDTTTTTALPVSCQDDESSSAHCRADKKLAGVCTVTGRIDFEKEISVGSVVFCQGSQALKAAVTKACRANKARFFGGRGGRA
jgi:hypothetical protein